MDVNRGIDHLQQSRLHFSKSSFWCKDFPGLLPDHIVGYCAFSKNPRRACAPGAWSLRA